MNPDKGFDEDQIPRLVGESMDEEHDVLLSSAQIGNISTTITRHLIDGQRRRATPDPALALAHAATCSIEASSLRFTAIDGILKEPRHTLIPDHWTGCTEPRENYSLFSWRVRGRQDLAAETSLRRRMLKLRAGCWIPCADVAESMTKKRFRGKAALDECPTEAQLLGHFQSSGEGGGAESGVYLKVGDGWMRALLRFGHILCVGLSIPLSTSASGPFLRYRALSGGMVGRA